VAITNTSLPTIIIFFINCSKGFHYDKVLWSNSPLLLLFLIPSLLFKTILKGFIILFLYMCIKCLDHISHSLLLPSSIPLVSITKESLHFTRVSFILSSSF
jgi:hypothetical protein